jgi:hypothetical protein
VESRCLLGRRQIRVPSSLSPLPLSLLSLSSLSSPLSPLLSPLLYPTNTWLQVRGLGQLRQPLLGSEVVRTVLLDRPLPNVARDRRRRPHLALLRAHLCAQRVGSQHQRMGLPQQLLLPGLSHSHVECNYIISVVSNHLLNWF